MHHTQRLMPPTQGSSVFVVGDSAGLCLYFALLLISGPVSTSCSSRIIDRIWSRLDHYSVAHGGDYISHVGPFGGVCLVNNR